jgi:hypothetical protein
MTILIDSDILIEVLRGKDTRNREGLAAMERLVHSDTRRAAKPPGLERNRKPYPLRAVSVAGTRNVKALSTGVIAPPAITSSSEKYSAYNTPRSIRPPVRSCRLPENSSGRCR